MLIQYTMGKNYNWFIYLIEQYYHTVGAYSVVTHDVPSYSVAAGIPANTIKLYNNKL